MRAHTNLVTNGLFANGVSRFRAMTLVEILVALAIIVVVLAVVVPQIRSIQNSWASKRANAEVIQNARALVDHITLNLMQAARIIRVSGPGETAGYIEFRDNDNVAMRYDVGSNDYVRFGPVANLSELAGSVSRLQFTCYDPCDFDTPITDPNSTRVVKVQATFSNPNLLSQDRQFTARVYLRTNAYATEPVGTAVEIDNVLSEVPALSRIDTGHYLCAYTGPGNDGWAAVLTVNLNDWTISKEIPFEFDALYGVAPALARIDGWHHLCVYESSGGPGLAVVFTINTASWTVTQKIPFVFDANLGRYPALMQIDNTHYLCAYTGPDNDGWAVVLTVNTFDWTVSKGAAFEFDSAYAGKPALSKIDSTHYLCAYEGPGSDGWAVVLTVNTGNWTITRGTPLEFDTISGRYPALSRIDATHYLCAYAGLSDTGWSVVLEVDPVLWTISKKTPFVYDSDRGVLASLARLDAAHYFCVYTGKNDDGWMLTLNVRSNWTIRKGIPFEFDPSDGVNSAITKINADHFLCVYQGRNNDGWGVILSPIPPIIP